MIPDFTTMWANMQVILADFGGLVQMAAGIWVAGLLLRAIISALGVKRQRIEDDDV